MTRDSWLFVLAITLALFLGCIVGIQLCTPDIPPPFKIENGVLVPQGGAGAGTTGADP